MQKPLRWEGKSWHAWYRHKPSSLASCISPGDDAEELDESDDDLGDDDADFDVSDVEECTDDSENSSEELRVDLPGYYGTAA